MSCRYDIMAVRLMYPKQRTTHSTPLAA